MNPSRDWLDPARRLVDAVTASLASPDGGATAGHGSDCRWCPVCQAAAVLRGERPEVTAALADVLASAATALRSFAEEGRAEAGEDPVADGGSADEPPPDEPPSTAQRIEIA